MLAGRLENVKQLERATVQGCGHFIHMQQPSAAAELILGYLER
jgi:pimeloyl-ACP methyl ester carboxylesterase